MAWIALLKPVIDYVLDVVAALRHRSDEAVYDYLVEEVKRQTLVSNPTALLPTGIPAATIATGLGCKRDSVLDSLKRLEKRGRASEKIDGWYVVVTEQLNQSSKRFRSRFSG